MTIITKKNWVAAAFAALLTGNMAMAADVPAGIQLAEIASKKPMTDLGVKAIDDHTLEVTLSEPVPYFYNLLIHRCLQCPAR